jgi:hypothetical protein
MSALLRLLQAISLTGMIVFLEFGLYWTAFFTWIIFSLAVIFQDVLQTFKSQKTTNPPDDPISDSETLLRFNSDNDMEPDESVPYSDAPRAH